MLRKTQSTWQWLESLHNSQSFEYFVTWQIVQAPCCHTLLLLLPQIFPQGFEEEKTLDRNSVCWEGRAVTPSGLRPVQRSVTPRVYQQVVMAVRHHWQRSLTSQGIQPLLQLENCPFTHCLCGLSPIADQGEGCVESTVTVITMCFTNQLSVALSL